MAHFAQVANGKVINVIVVNNDVLDPDNEEVSGQEFLASLFPGTSPEEWVQTSYNGNTRGKYASIGDTWDSGEERFVRPAEVAAWEAEVAARLAAAEQ